MKFRIYDRFVLSNHLLIPKYCTEKHFLICFMNLPAKSQKMQQDAMNSTMTMNQISSTSQIRTSVADIFNPPPYSSIFFHSAPSPTPFAAHPVTSDGKCTRNTDSATAAAAKSLSRMMSEHKELLSRHAFCLTHLRKTFKEAETLRQENTNLRLANVELSKHVNFLIQITSQSQYQTQPFTENFGGDFEMEKDSEGWDEGFSAKNQSPTSEIEKDEEENQKDDAARVTLPKSISVRSNGFLKMSQTGGGPSGSNSGALRAATRIRPPNPVTGPVCLFMLIRCYCSSCFFVGVDHDFSLVI